MKRWFAFWMGPVSIIIYLLGNALFEYVRSRVQPALLHSGHLGYWWLVTVLYVFSLALAVAGVAALAYRKYIPQLLSARMKPILTSLSLDLLGTLAFWTLSLIFADPLLRSMVQAVGLQYLPIILFVGGIIWFSTGIVRIKTLSELERSPANG